jgi:hypothetical protein
MACLVDWRFLAGFLLGFVGDFLRGFLAFLLTGSLAGFLADIPFYFGFLLIKPWHYVKQSRQAKAHKDEQIHQAGNACA